MTKYCVLIGDIEFLFGRAVVLFDKATHALSDLLTAGDYQVCLFTGVLVGLWGLAW